MEYIKDVIKKRNVYGSVTMGQLPVDGSIMTSSREDLINMLDMPYRQYLTRSFPLTTVVNPQALRLVPGDRVEWNLTTGQWEISNVYDSEMEEDEEHDLWN